MHFLRFVAFFGTKNLNFCIVFKVKLYLLVLLCNVEFIHSINMTYNINVNLPKIDLDFANTAKNFAIKNLDFAIPQNIIMSIDTSSFDSVIKELFFAGSKLREIEKQLESEFGAKMHASTISRTIKKNGWKEELQALKKQGVVDAVSKISQENKDSNKDKPPESDDNNKKSPITLTIEERYNDAHHMRKSAMKAIYDTLFVQEEKEVFVNPKLKSGTVLLFAVQLFKASNDDLFALDKLLKEKPKEEIQDLDATWYDEIQDKL